MAKLITMLLSLSSTVAFATEPSSAPWDNAVFTSSEEVRLVVLESLTAEGIAHGYKSVDGYEYLYFDGNQGLQESMLQDPAAAQLSSQQQQEYLELVPSADILARREVQNAVAEARSIKREDSAVTGKCFHTEAERSEIMLKLAASKIDHFIGAPAFLESVEPRRSCVLWLDKDGYLVNKVLQKNAI